MMDPGAIDVNIREYHPDDFDAVNQLWENIGLGGKHRGDTPDVILNTLMAGGRLMIMENHSSREIIGTSWLTTDSRRIYLHHFGIAKRYQGQGLSKRLLDASMKIVREKGLQVKLEVHRDNHKALNLYRSAGFEYLGDYEVFIIRNI